jgi:sigma-B regulation protein RsbU (phosphoserine phosphatase)
VRQGYLIRETNGRGAGRVSVGASITIGRSVECGCIIDDAAASRRHVRIVALGDRFEWEDLQSMNGTQLNGQRKKHGVLHDGDRLQIGETVLRFEVVDEPDEPMPEESTTIFTETLVNWQQSGQSGIREPHAEELLRAVYAITNELASNYEPCALVDRILETTMQAIDAQRGAILFCHPGGDDLSPCPVCHRFHMIQHGRVSHVPRGDVLISKTVAHRVFSKGESLLYQDSDRDRELNLADSIASLKLRSIICTPLRGKFDVFGILYVDSDRPRQQYTHDDMLLLTAVGNSAGLALENARMHGELVEKLRIEQEIETAASIQRGFLPQYWPEGQTRYLVYGDTRPAKTVGGDFYDYLPSPDGRLGVLIGDVSGKGVPAALTMALLLAEFRRCAQVIDSPADVLIALNESFVSRNPKGSFCTMLYAILDLESRKVVSANAGHHPAMAIGKRGVRLFGSASGPPVGILSEGPWTNTETELSPGESTLLLYTDGIVEARRAKTLGDGSAAHEEYGIENLAQAATQCYETMPRELIESVQVAVSAFCAPEHPHDDCTMIAVKMLD